MFSQSPLGLPGDQELEGSIRLTLPDTSGMGFLMKRLAEFAETYPGIDLELMPSVDALDLSRREADIAIRVMPPGVSPPDYLIGRRLGRMTASAYVHRDMLNPDNPDDISHLTWIGKNPQLSPSTWILPLPITSALSMSKKSIVDGFNRKPIKRRVA